MNLGQMLFRRVIERALPLLIHCGYGFGQVAIVSRLTAEGREGATPPAMPSFRASPNDRGDRSRETSGRPGVQALPAQSSSLAIGSAGRSKCEIPNGLGSEFCLWSIASSIRVQSHR